MSVATKNRKGQTYYVNGRKLSKCECLIVYSKFCDDFNLTHEKGIENKSAKYIFKKCNMVYNNQNKFKRLKLVN